MPEQSGDGVYLAGPVEADDNPSSWRDGLKERYPHVRFIDPMDWQEDWDESPEACIARELEVCETHPILACNIGRDAPRTVGTHHEIAHALANGNDRIAVVPNGDLPGFIEYREVELFDNVDDAVLSLIQPTTPKVAAADGGEGRV